MNTPQSRSLLAALAVSLILPGCATPSDKSKDKPDDAYTDPASGVVFPKHFQSLDRVSLNTDDSGKNPVMAHYTATDPIHSPEDSIPLMQSHLAFYLNADIRILPASATSPDQLLSESIRSLESNPNFTQSDYRGVKTFGSEPTFSTQCSFDRPAWGDRVIFKVLIIPRGNYLLCFTFLLRSSQEGQWQSVIDSFVQETVTKSAKHQVYMIPSAAPGAKPPRDEDNT